VHVERSPRCDVGFYADVDLMTCDKLEDLTKGHGMLNMAVYSIANVIA